LHSIVELIDYAKSLELLYMYSRRFIVREPQLRTLIVIDLEGRIRVSKSGLLASGYCDIVRLDFLGSIAVVVNIDGLAGLF
ncbi:hypothetical protein AF384_24420, partial [Salmonella enterica subsp. enterica serovar Typhimurium]